MNCTPFVRQYGILQRDEQKQLSGGVEIGSNNKKVAARAKKGIKHQGGQGTALHRAYEVTRITADSGKSHSQSRNVCQGVQIGGVVCVMNPKTFPAGSLKTGVVAFTFGAKCIRSLELRALPVNGTEIVANFPKKCLVG